MKKELKEKTEIVKKTAEELLRLLGIQAKVSASEDKENEAILVSLETNQPAILIGFHGETLEAFQLILALMVNKKFPSWQRVIVNIGDYREKRAEQLKNLALNTAQRVKFSGQLATLSGLSSSERRLIHLALSDHSEVETFSEGEGEDRHLVVKPKVKTAS